MLDSGVVSSAKSTIAKSLFLPQVWIKDKKRCEKAKIHHTVFKTKHQQAIEMIFLARKNGVRSKWVGFDSFFGDNPAFLRQLAEKSYRRIYW
ncbi:MAG: transposase [Proteobacteria bacterium]|nr:transposase [Pseudomonadota bacterium]